MEGSSPLAFARPALPPSAWSYHNDQSYNPNLLNPAYVAPSFNFQSMASRGRKPDYFSCKTVRDSSPASALAVDLAQNLQVDQRYVWSMMFEEHLLTALLVLNYQHQDVHSSRTP